jgi:ABC-type lipoprotein export system ATPase subunit
VTEAVAVLDHATRSFKRRSAEVVAVCDASARIDPGARVALTGPSGSGKTTLLHLLAGLDVPTEGTVGWPLLGDRSTLRPGKVAVVFQGASLIAALNTEQNVALPLLMQGGEEKECEARAVEMMQALGLGDLVGRLPQEISGGQAQRVAMARALVVEPSLLLADEPTGQLDHATAIELMHKVLELIRPGCAILLATHDESVGGLMDRTWRMRGGRLEEAS